MRKTPTKHKRRPPLTANQQQKINEHKHQLCAAIDRLIDRFQLTATQAAFELKTSTANISRVRNRQVEQLTFNQLFDYLVRLKTNHQILVSI